MRKRKKFVSLYAKYAWAKSQLEMAKMMSEVFKLDTSKRQEKLKRHLEVIYNEIHRKYLN